VLIAESAVTFKEGCGPELLQIITRGRLTPAAATGARATGAFRDSCIVPVTERVKDCE